MDKIYTAQDIKDVIAKVEELAMLNAELEELLYRGSIDEKFVDRKRELESSIRKYKSIVSESEEQVEKEPIQEDLDLVALKIDFDSIVLRYKTRRRELQNIIKSYTNGNVN